MKNAIMALLMSVSLAACSAQWHIRRAIKKDPSIVTESTRVDTTIILKPHVIYDSFVTESIDTIVVEDSVAYTRVIRWFDTIKVYTKCKGDTITVYQTTPPRIKYVKPEGVNWKFVTYSLIVILFLYVLSRLLTFVSKSK